MRLGLFFFIQPWQINQETKVILKKDAVGYHQIAKNYLDMGIHTKSKQLPHNPDKVRVPLYPMFLAGVYGVFGEKPWLVLFFQIIIGAFTSVMVYKTARYYIRESPAFLAGLLYCLDYTAIFYTSNLLTETLFICLLVLHIYFLTLFFTASNSPRGYPELVLSGVEASTRRSDQQSDISDQRSAISPSASSGQAHQQQTQVKNTATNHTKTNSFRQFSILNFKFSPLHPASTLRYAASQLLRMTLKTFQHPEPVLRVAETSSIHYPIFNIQYSISALFLAAATHRPVTAYWFICLLPIFLLHFKNIFAKGSFPFFFYL
ncbi:MAG: glycosyltransferase family 39 protein [Calditrichia bacterium]